MTRQFVGVAGVAAGITVALLASWISGGSGRSDMVVALQTSELRNELLGARAAVHDARDAIDGADFDDASRHLQGARELLQHAEERLKRLGLDDEFKQVQAALASIEDAQRMARKLDQSVNRPAEKVDHRRSGRRRAA